MVAWVFLDHLLLRDFGPYRIVFVGMMTFDMLMLLRYVKPYGIIFMIVCSLLKLLTSFLKDN
jgi:hypothetical protein